MVWRMVPWKRLAERHGARILVAGAAGAAGAVGLAVFEPVKAKTPETKQQVFVWGRHSAIPGGSHSDVLWPQRIEWFEQNPKGWKKIAFGPDFGGAIDAQGQLYVWGSVGAHSVGPVRAEIQGAGRGQGLEDLQFSAKKMFALTRRGDALSFDDFLNVLQERVAPKAALRKAQENLQKASEEEKAQFEAALKEAELAAGRDVSDQAPLKLKAKVVSGLPRAGWFAWLQGYRGCVQSMSIGMEHGCFVTHQGQLYCVGGNEYGQCGMAPPKQRGPMGALEERRRVEVDPPVRVEFPRTAAPIKKVEVGGRHTIAQDAKGRSYSFGDDRRIQLALGDTRTGGQDERHAYGVLSQDGPKNVKGDIQRAVSYRYYDPHMQTKPVQQVAPLAINRPEYPPASFFSCGEDFTVGIFRDSPDWYAASHTTTVAFACGENGAGQCGRSMHQQQQVWSQVRLPKHSRVDQLRCGQAHCLALLKDGRLFAWGSNPQGQVGNGKRSLVSRPIVITQRPELPSGLAQLADNDMPQTVTPQDLYKRAVYQHAQSRSSNQFSGPDVPESPMAVELPGTIVSIQTGFRNSAVICEVPA